MSKDDVKQAITTALTGVICFYVTRWLQLPQGYWAVMSALIVMQAKVDATVNAAGVRLAGTAIGALIGGVFFVSFGTHVWAFAVAVAIVVLLCSLLKFSESYRLASVTVAIIMLAPHTEPPLTVAFYRFIEVSLGIIVALALTALIHPPETYTALYGKFIKKS